MLDKKVDTIILLNSDNRFFYSKMHTSFGVVILTELESVFITDSRYAYDARQTLKDWNIVITTGADMYNAIASECKRLGSINVAYEDDSILKNEFDALSSILAECNMVPFSKFISDEKAIKNDETIGYMQEAQRISELALANVMQYIKVGVTEKEIAARIVFDMIMKGADEPSFDTIVAFGENSAKPHHRPSYKKFEKGDIILIDMGAKYKGYCSDMTRTFALSDIDPRLATIHGIVVAAQNYALKNIKAGITCSEVDAMCREYIKANGYDKEFSHSTGHGIGIAVHEYPRVSANSDSELIENMVITVEPGVYVEGLGGVRIEDMVVVKKDGIHNLTTFSKDIRHKV